MGVGCKLLPFVVYCLLFVMMSTNTEKNSAVSEQGHVLTAYVFFPWSKLSQYNTTPDLSSFYTWSKCMTSRVRSTNTRKQAKRKNSVKTRDQTQKKRYDKETENSVTVAGSRTQLICKQCNSLTTAPQWHTLFKKLILSYLNNFSLP